MNWLPVTHIFPYYVHRLLYIIWQITITCTGDFSSTIFLILAFLSAYTEEV